jgi:hypothetical protein
VVGGPGSDGKNTEHGSNVKQITISRMYSNDQYNAGKYVQGRPFEKICSSAKFMLDRPRCK